MNGIVLNDETRHQVQTYLFPDDIQNDITEVVPQNVIPFRRKDSINIVPSLKERVFTQEFLSTLSVSLLELCSSNAELIFTNLNKQEISDLQFNLLMLKQSLLLTENISGNIMRRCRSLSAKIPNVQDRLIHYQEEIGMGVYPSLFLSRPDSVHNNEIALGLSHIDQGLDIKFRFDPSHQNITDVVMNILGFCISPIGSDRWGFVESQLNVSENNRIFKFQNIELRFKTGSVFGTNFTGANVIGENLSYVMDELKLDNSQTVFSTLFHFMFTRI